MDLKRRLRLSVSGLALAACTSAAAPPVIPNHSATFPASDGAAHPLVDPDAPFTVIEFFSAHCPCQTAHDARLRALAADYGARGVAFRAVDAELDATPARARDEAARRAYPYPIVVDPSGGLARDLGAKYATFTVVASREGQVMFAGGIDSDKSHLRDDTTPYLRDALDDALAGRPVRNARPKTLGCSLTLR